jgi:hypothetical protein
VFLGRTFIGQPVIATVWRLDADQHFTGLHGLEVGLECGRSYIRRVENEGGARWNRPSGATVRSRGTHECSISRKDIAIHGKVMSRGNGNTVSECTDERVV